LKLKITVDNKTYEVDVEASDPEQTNHPPRGYVVEPAAVRVPAANSPNAALAAPQTAADESKVCRSPISGIVVKVAAQPGQTIQTGDILLVLEAMKMETNITAPINGKVARVNVSPGDGVQNGQILVEFE
jgi:methylmalonyl-CoA carboxyltransferase small subunit